MSHVLYPAKLPAISVTMPEVAEYLGLTLNAQVVKRVCHFDNGTFCVTLLDTDNNVIAESPEAYRTKEAAEQAANDLGIECFYRASKWDY
jgi:hypothetical protein